MYLERLLSNKLAILAAPGAFMQRLAHPDLVSFGLLANLQRLARVPALAGIDAVVDVGANTGQFAFMAHRVWPRLPVISFEPDPVCVAALTANRSRHGIPGEIVASAVGADATPIELQVYADRVNNSRFARVGELPADRVRVASVALDEFFGGRPAPVRALLKIDTQGAELGVIHGARAFLSRCRGVLVEVAVRQAYAGAARFPEVLEQMEQLGFVAFDVVDTLRGPDRDGRPLRELDLLFVPVVPAP